jgi:hypothetical protein
MNLLFFFITPDSFRRMNQEVVRLIQKAIFDSVIDSVKLNEESGGRNHEIRS